MSNICYVAIFRLLVLTVHHVVTHIFSLQVRSIVPDAAPVGSLVEIGGQYFFNEENYHLYQHIYVGTQLCELRDPINNRYYGIEDRSGLRYIRCLMKEQLPGAYNASTFLSYDDRTSMAMDGGLLARGKSVNHSLSLKLDHTNRISMIELYPGEEGSEGTRKLLQYNTFSIVIKC